MTPDEVSVWFTRWIPGSWKYTPGERELIGDRATAISFDIANSRMMRMVAGRDTTFKMPMSSILSVFRVDANPDDGRYDPVAPREQLCICLDAIDALTTASTPGARRSALKTMLTSADAIGWRFADEQVEKYSRVVAALDQGDQFAFCKEFQTEEEKRRNAEDAQAWAAPLLTLP